MYIRVILLAASNDSSRMVARDSDTQAGYAIAPHRWGRDVAHSAAREPGLRLAHVHDVAIVVHSMRRDHTRHGRTPSRPWDETLIRWNQVRLRPQKQRLDMHVYFSVVTPVCIMHACRIEPRNDPQGYYPVVGIRVEEAWHRSFRVYRCCERVAVEDDAAGGFKCVAPELGDWAFRSNVFPSALPSLC